MKHNINTGTEVQKAEQQQAIQRQLNRLLQEAPVGTPDNTHNQNKHIVITKVLVRPNPFFTAITLDVTSEQSRHTIVRMYDTEGHIVKMFSWFLVKGTNVTSINEINSLSAGKYHLDMIDNEGKLLYSTNVTKENLAHL
ncbi:hypothetical protein D3H65_31070 [Paraflavitalea soli]|uniref:T9SS C-terminal target domain-containing protein n=1 Tax=Paraflavitalea soli TaxID=2315862 RepID=A0A3B7MYJ7_9BACT|nr:hypothetical protein [Paraflavitalea soli]AXY78170.1 hypothetical protein D3H65_31070 [Paraflavitalea soli]